MVAAADNVPTVPESVSDAFPQWLASFLSHYCHHHGHHHPANRDEEKEEDGGEGEMLAAPEGLPPVYYRWLCLFAPRFFWRQQQHRQSQGGEGRDLFLS